MVDPTDAHRSRAPTCWLAAAKIERSRAPLHPATVLESGCERGSPLGFRTHRRTNATFRALDAQIFDRDANSMYNHAFSRAVRGKPPHRASRLDRMVGSRRREAKQNSE
jgi:hypothetical protein